jgi:hypothetical protein
VEAVLILVALAFGGFLLARAMSSPAAEPLPPTGRVMLPASVAVGAPLLVGTAPTRLPLHIYTAASARLHRSGEPAPAGAEYTLALGRQPGGRWASVLHVPPTAQEGGALTVTLVVPWADLIERYSAVNLVVR